MNHYLIKLIIYSTLTLGVLACSSGLDKKYNPSSKEKDYQEIQKEVSPEEFRLIKDYIQNRTAENNDLSDYTYDQILFFAKMQENERIERERHLAEQAKQKAAEEEIIRPKKELLCSKKWKIQNIEYVITTSEDSVMILKVTDAGIKAFTGNGKRQKIYLRDSTYQEMFGREEGEKGNWKFIGQHKIQETRPSALKLNSRLNNKEVYMLTIDILDEKQFRYIEEKVHSGYGISNATRKLVTLTAVGD